MAQHTLDRPVTSDDAEHESRRAVTRGLLACGAAAGPLYVSVSLAQALTRDGFDLGRHPWSMLANGSLGWVQVANFVVTGLLVVLAAAGARRVLDGGAASRWAPRLLAAYGVSLVAAGVFRADPANGFPAGTPAGAGEVSWHGTLHFLAGGIGFTCVAVACFVLARRFRAEGRRGFAAWSVATGAVFLTGFGMLASSGGSRVGLLLFVAAVVALWTWLTAVSAHLGRLAHLAGLARLARH